MGTALLKGLMAVLTRMFMSMASEQLIEWLLFFVIEKIVESTKTPYDNELYVKMREAYDASKVPKRD